MSRKKSFIENLSTEEKAVLEYEKKYGKSDAYRIRCHAILLSNKSFTTNEIATILEVTKSSIYNWFSAWRTDGIEGLKTKSGQGRKPVLSTDNSDHVEGVKKAVKKVAQEGGNLLNEIQTELELEDGLTKKMLSLFLQKLITPGNVFVKE